VGDDGEEKYGREVNWKSGKPLTGDLGAEYKLRKI
jgi:hypothetical protein